MDKKGPESPKRQWEQTLIDDYYDHRWREILQPLYEKFQRWRAGELNHAAMNRAIHETHKQTRELYSLFTQRRPLLVKLIQLDREWFQAWVKYHKPPRGVELAPFAPLEREEDTE